MHDAVSVRVRQRARYIAQQANGIRQSERPRAGEPADAWVALERLLLAVAEPRAARLLAG